MSLDLNEHDQLDALEGVAFRDVGPEKVRDPGSMPSFEEAYRASIRLAASMPRLPQTTRTLSLLTGRVLAGAIHAPDAVPTSDTAQVDGYAIQSRDLVGPGPWSFRVSGHVPAGEKMQAEIIHRKSAVRLAAGACLRHPYDRIVPSQHVRHSGPVIEIDAPVDPQTHVQPRGDVFRANELVVAPGKLLNACDVALLALAGLGDVPVLRKLRVAVLSVGEGLVDSEAAGPGAATADVNRPMLEAKLSERWIEVRDFGIVPGGPDALRLTLDMASAWADVILTTGGTLGGADSQMAGALTMLQAMTHVAGIAMEPGCNTRIGQIGGCLFVAMPGDPVVVEIIMTTLVQAILAHRVGLPDGGPAFARGISETAVAQGSEQTRFRLVQVFEETGCQPQALRLIDPQQCSVRALATASGVARIAPARDGIEVGHELIWFPFHPGCA